MNLPSKIKIGGHQYVVVFPYVFTERFDRVGDCDYSKNIIRIADSLGNEKRSNSVIITTLIHEILHAIDNVTGQDMFAGDIGDRMVDGLAEGIYQVLIDNPELRKGKYYDRETGSSAANSADENHTNE